MEKEVRRYRVRPKKYLCLYPEEALSVGISVGEETLEELVLIKASGFGYSMYAALEDKSEEELMKTPFEERNEVLFESRREAVNYIKGNPGRFSLFGVKEIKQVDRGEMAFEETESTDDIMEQFKDFGKE